MNGYFLAEGQAMPSSINYNKNETVSWTELVENQKVLFIGLPDSPTNQFDFDLIKNGTIQFSILKYQKIMLLTTDFLAKQRNSNQLQPLLRFDNPFHPNINDTNPQEDYTKELDMLKQNANAKSIMFIVAFNSSTGIIERVRAIEIDNSFSLKMVSILNTINQNAITYKEFNALVNDLYNYEPHIYIQLTSGICIVDGDLYI